MSNVINNKIPGIPDSMHQMPSMLSANNEGTKMNTSNRSIQN